MRRQGSLGLFHFSSKFTQRSLVGGHVDIVLSLVLLDEVVDDPVVKVFSTQMRVTGGRENFENSVFDGQERDIKGSSSEIVDDNLRFGLARSVETVGWG